MNNKKINQVDLSAKSGVNRSIIGRILRDETKSPRNSTMLTFSGFFGCDLHWLATGDGEPFPEDDKKAINEAVRLDIESMEKQLKEHALSHTNIPVISWVQAGEWTEIVDEFQPGDANEFVIVFKSVSKGTFGLRITGESMEPEFTAGEIIVVDPEVQPETSKFVVAKIESDNGDNGEATLKQFIRDGNKIYLKPLNDKYELMDMTGKDFVIVGCVVSKTKEY